MTRRPRAGCCTQYFEIMGSRAHLPRRLDGLRLRPARPVGPGTAARHPRVDAGQGHLGALQPGRGLDAGQRPRGQDAGEARADEGAVPDRGDEEQCAADRRRSLGPASASRDACWRRPTRSGPSPATSPACRSSPPRRWATSRTSSPSMPTSRPMPTACSTSWAGSRRPHLLRRERDPLLRVQPLRDQRTKIRATQKLPVGKAKIEVETVYVEPKPAGR